MIVLHETSGVTGLFHKAATLFVAAALFMMPVLANACASTLVCDEFGARSLPLSEEEEVKHACTVGFHLLLGLGTPELRDQAPAPPDERIEAATHGEVAVPPPRPQA